VTSYPPSYRPPRDCPVCSSRLEITQLGCPSCGTGLSGHFAPSEFSALDDADLTMLRVFLASRGNMRDLERHLGVSYPTARARFDDLLRRLGLIGNGQAGADAGGAGGAGSSAAPAASASASSSASASEAERLATLEALAEGRLDVDSARERLAGD
jgi:hypothetical protein